MTKLRIPGGEGLEEGTSPGEGGEKLKEESRQLKVGRRMWIGSPRGHYREDGATQRAVT